MGDELADRGVCDYLILIIIEKMAKEEIPYEIIISNHALEFLRVFQEYFYEDSSGPLFEATEKNEYLSSAYPSQYRSLDILLELIDKGYLERDSVIKLVTTYYLPHLKLVSYALKRAENTIRIFTHAPIDLLILEAAAKKFDVSYKDRTIQELAELIDTVNGIFKTQIEEGTKITDLFPPHTLRLISSTRNMTSLRYLKKDTQCVFAWLTWNRRIDGVLSALTEGEYNILFVHGHHHDFSQKTQTTFDAGQVSWSSLDSMYGKDESEIASSSEQHILLSLGSQEVHKTEEEIKPMLESSHASDTDSGSVSEDKMEVAEPASKRFRK